VFGIDRLFLFGHWAIMPAMLPLKVPAGAKILLGAPARPMPRERSDAISNLVASIGGITEAHLPQCFLAGAMQAPAQVLVVVVDPNADQEAVLNGIGAGLSRILGTGETLDVLPIKLSNAILENVRGAGCRILNTKQRRRWWKFW
jgi:hypothetical protein